MVVPIPARDPRRSGAGSASRPWVGALALAALPGLVLVDSAVQLARGWRAGGPFDRAVLGLAAATAAVPLALLLLRPARAWLGRRGPQLALAVIGLAAGLLLAELGARLARPPTGFHLRPASLDRVNRTDPELMPGIEGGARYRTNSLGVRGSELPADRSIPRILFLGGSTTECLYLDDSETWPQLVGAALSELTPVWVGAAGRSGRTSVHHLRFLEESELLRSGGLDVVVLLAGLNDMTKAFLGVSEDEQRAGDLLPLWHRSHLAGIVHGLVDGWLSARAGRLEHWAVHLPRQQAERAAGTKRDPELDLGPWLDAYGARLGRIAALCREHGARPIFLTQPVQWREGLSPEVEARFWFGWLEQGGFSSVRGLRSGIEAFNARTLEVGARLGVPVVDLSAMHGDTRFYFDDCHFTEAGSRELARRLADWMLAHREAWLSRP